MTSDDDKRSTVSAFRPVGTGMYQTFLCARCNKFKSMPGRKKARVNGLFTYICASCGKDKQ